MIRLPYDLAVSIKSSDDLSPEGEALPALANRLGYLLKHAQMRLTNLTGAAMAPFGINGRECAVLIAIDDRHPVSQQEVARKLGVDRTTMVALIDVLETQGLVQRRQDPDDRRRNLVELTRAGKDTLRNSSPAGGESERHFLGAMPDAEAGRFTRAVPSPPCT